MDHQGEIGKLQKLGEKKGALLNQIKSANNGQQEEKTRILDIAGKFALFMKDAALIPFNDAFKSYLEMLIRN